MKNLHVCGLVTFLNFFAAPVDASLGGSADSVETDRRMLLAAPGPVIDRGAYTIKTLHSESATVREYISKSGVVFGLAWTGIRHPPRLFVLFGSHAGDFRRAVGNEPRGRGPRHHRVNGDRITVEMWGHQRRLEGRAYVTDLIPAGVNPNEIR